MNYCSNTQDDFFVDVVVFSRQYITIIYHHWHHTFSMIVFLDLSASSRDFTYAFIDLISRVCLHQTGVDRLWHFVDGR